MKTFSFAVTTLAVISLAACTPVGDNGNSESSSSMSSEASSTMVNEHIRNVSVEANDTVSSPLTITGEASGWYFEASFPVHLLDGNGNEIVSAPAQAQSDWMTTDFVPFSVTLTFATPATSTGTLVLEKDNPSGMPENAESIVIPVQF